MKSTNKNQPKSKREKGIVSVRLDSYDRKCIEIMAKSNGYTLSRQIALIVASSTAQVKALYNESQLDQVLETLEKNENR